VTELSQACEAVHRTVQQEQKGMHIFHMYPLQFVYLAGIDVALWTQAYYCRATPTAQGEKLLVLVFC
jgi:hypothetical protein